jgi:hypothetical protein
MKKSLMVLMAGLLLASFSTSAFTQETGDKKDVRFTIKTNPMSALGGPLWVTIVPITAEYKVYFEAKTTARQSVQLGLGYLGSSPLIKSISDLGEDTTLSSSGLRGQLWYKFFLTSDNAPGGFYIGPHVSYASAKMKVSSEPGEYFKASKLNFHVAFGYQIISKGGFALDIFTGIGMKSKKYELSDPTLNDDLGELELDNKSGISVPLGFSFGYAF